jgi:hypothetical protein
MIIVDQLLIAASNILGLEAAKAQNQGIKIALHTAENLTKLLAFSDLGFNTKIASPKEVNLTKSYSVLGALGLTAMLAMDDLAINNGLYKNHHLGKVGSAIYAGLKCSNNNIADVKTDISTAAMWSGALLAGSYLVGSGDIVDIMRSNTNDSIEFADEVYDTSNGVVNIEKDMILGSLVGSVLSGGRQIMQPLSLEIGAPLNGVISTTTSTAVNIISSSNSEKNFKNILVDKFQYKLRYISSEQINKLDDRAQKVFEKLPEYIDKASSCITKNATNAGVKTSYQNILASSEFYKQHDMGLSVFVISNLFNLASPDNLHRKVQKNLNALKADDDFNRLTHDEKIYDIGKKLNVLQDKKSDSIATKLLNYGKTVVKLIAPVFIGSILVTRMHDDTIFNKAVFAPQTPDNMQSKMWRSAYMPIVSILSIGETFIDVDAFTAIKQLQYLEDALEKVYTYDSLAQDSYSECIQHPETFGRFN